MGEVISFIAGQAYQLEIGIRQPPLWHGLPSRGSVRSLTTANSEKQKRRWQPGKLQRRVDEMARRMAEDEANIFRMLASPTGFEPVLPP